jgi:hypothetical protein|tara:strand:+ start:63 stop:257 length:195 start_codon:yes stop_codon:yes gene_type:complete
VKVVTKRKDDNKQVAKITVELESKMYPLEDITGIVLDIVEHLKDLDVGCVKSEGKSKIIITFDR